MIVTYRYMGIPFRGMDFQTKQMELKENATIRVFMNCFLEQYPFCDQSFVEKSCIFVNKVNADHKTILHDGDSLLVMKVLGGG